MHVTNLNPDTLETYLRFLSSHGLISGRPNGRRGSLDYEITGKGEEAISRMRSVAELLPLSRTKL